MYCKDAEFTVFSLKGPYKDIQLSYFHVKLMELLWFHLVDDDHVLIEFTYP